MLTWRCPHCATVQAEAPRCFLCDRSATSCGTCALFRRSLVNGLGYCALDRRREPLSGAEQRGCWVATDRPPLDGFFVAPPAPPAQVAQTRPAQSARRLIDLG